MSSYNIVLLKACYLLRLWAYGPGDILFSHQENENVIEV